MMVTFDRGDYWQCAYVIAKGQYDRVKARGVDAFRDDVISMAPILKSGISDVKTWDDVKLLTVAINRLKRWTRRGPALHRRRRPRDVAGRRLSASISRCRMRFATATCWRRSWRAVVPTKRAGCGAKAAGVSDPDDASHAGRCSE